MLKKLINTGIAVFLLSALFCSSALAAAQKGPGPVISDTPQPISAVDIERVDLPAEAEIAVVVEGKKDQDHGILYVYRKNDDQKLQPGFEQVLRTECFYGKAGLYKTIEGDCKTPVGIFKMNTPFGIKDAQEGFPENYLKVTKDHYWIGDSNSPRYNTLANIKEYNQFRTKGSEHIIDYTGYYNYCIDSGYNPELTPHKGSAIFLHCKIDPNTHGCIAVDEAQMIEIMKLYREGKSYMVVADEADVKAVYKKD